MIRILPLLFLLLINVAWADDTKSPASDPWEKRINKDGVLVIDWGDLVPADFQPDKLFQNIAKKYNLKELRDDDPRTKQIQTEINNIWNNAPVVESLNGRKVRLPGLVIPLEGDGKTVSEFLLVPYFGACIHVPPPPSNQIVYVTADSKKTEIHEIYEPVWVTGTLRTEHQHKDMGDSSYTVTADRVEPYSDKEER
jgi:uncharacterized protein